MTRYLLLPLLIAFTIVAGAAELPEKIEFNKHIRPLLSDRCFLCHGPDSGTREADLRLDIRDAALEERDGVRAIVPGDPDASEAILRILSHDTDEQMPPKKSKLPPLTKEEQAIFRKWVEQGAEYQPHWAFVPLPLEVRPPVLAEGAVAWARNPIDNFVVQRLQQEKLAPAPEASRERWIRRVTFDLTGLPPTQAELNAFLGDTSPEAFEKVADRLLASPRFGERMAVPWLDVARYADSYGYQSDEEMRAWPYRDWVIRALNDNLPWDQFITWQLAGDLMPNATRDQRLATAFNRIHRKTQEGGSVEAEFLQDGVGDRVHTVGTAFLGLTFECARCHDHKYDAISQRDYYALGAFFNSIDEWGLLHNFGDKAKQIQPHPVLYLTTPEQETVLEAQEQTVETAGRVVAELQMKREDAFREWLSGVPVQRLPDQVGKFRLDEVKDGKMANDAKTTKPATLGGGNTVTAAKVGQGVQFNGDDGLEIPSENLVHCHDATTISFWLKPAEAYPRAVVLHKTTGFDSNFSGFELLLENGQLRWTWAREWPGNAISVRTDAKVPVGDWTHVAVSYDGSRRASGLRIHLNGQPAVVEVLRDKLTKDVLSGSALEFGRRSRDNGLRGSVLDEINVFTRALAPIEVAHLADSASLDVQLSKATRTDAEVAALREYYFSAIDPEVRAATAALRGARVGWREIMDQVQEIPTMEEMPKPRPAFVLQRGAYDAPGDPVDRSTPAALPAFPNDAPRNRLGLAQWLTSRQHPLTARVLVNRLWQEFFATGLVATADNFGSQGTLPSHPELLDWLARDFVASGWDHKRACKQIVLSATYRQDSRTSPELRQRDPGNVLLARGPAKRLGAEALRDGALALGGLLRGKIGGPPVKPYQPEGSMWKALNNFLPEYQRDRGEGLWRRSLYTYWRRTTPPPNMMSFDSAGKEVCSVGRQLTSTPLQPLILMNDPQFVEAGRALGERMLTEGGETPKARVAWAFREVTGRSATERELAELQALYAEQRELFQTKPEEATRLLKVGDHRSNSTLPAPEVAAAATTANALFNLDAAYTLR
ncbi:MAG TPA: DUF1553 domain-containing protein [Chthoniobacteraceae bacterium]